MGFGFGLMEAVFPVLFVIVFVIVIGGFLFTAVTGVSQWHKNNQSPRLTVDAQVVSRYENVTTHHHNDGDGVGHTSHSTTYYVTFQVESGDRMEFSVPRSEYGFLVEGDRGKLSFQGTRYLGFERM